MKQQMYAIGDMFYNEIDDIIEEALEDNCFESVSDVPDDFSIQYSDCEPAPIYKLDADLLCGMIEDHFVENHSEDGNEWDGVKQLIEKHFDLDAFNAEAPELYMPNGVMHTITRDDVVKYMSENPL
jgi:hypothetical protein